MAKPSVLLGSAAAALTLFLATPAIAQDVIPSLALDAPAPAPTLAALSPEDADTLKPGQFLWRPELATDGAVEVTVDLGTQHAYVYRGATLIGISTISSGREGHDTPLGVFNILQKAVDHKSNLYSAAPMPYMQRLTWDGIALHAGKLPGYPASHGCIRLPMAFAKALYGVTSLGATVQVAMATTVANGMVEPDLTVGRETVALADDGATAAPARPGGKVSLASYSPR
jgi:hypothetical protein